MSTITATFHAQNESTNNTFSNILFEECKDNTNTSSTNFTPNQPEYFMQNNLNNFNTEVPSSLTTQIEEYEKIQSEVR